MTTATLREARELVAEHLEVLRAYAYRVLVQDQALSEGEQEDRKRRTGEFLAMGSCLKLTEREMVVLVYRDTLRTRRQCGCRTCRSRASSGR
jgi:hypothetical protein